MIEETSLNVSHKAKNRPEIDDWDLELRPSTRTATPWAAASTTSTVASMDGQDSVSGNKSIVHTVILYIINTKS